MRLTTRTRSITVIAAVAAAIAAHQVSAQTAASNALGATDNGDQLQEVVVTAEKRTENLQSLPETVTAVSGAELLAQGIKDITDIARVAPEVNVEAVGSMDNLVIRGIKTNSFGPTLDSPNAVYVDGAYNARFTSLNGLFFDVARIEVLDGPQGTLYGRNSVGGAMNVISNKPTQTFGGYGWVEYGNYNDLSVNGALNLPITDTLAFRLAYMRNSHSGYETDSGQDALDIQGGRAELLWKPSGDDSLLLTGQFSTVGGKGPGALTITHVFKNPTILTDTTTGNVLPYNSGCPTTPTPDVCTGQVVPINATNDPRHNATLVGSANLYNTDTRNDAFGAQYDHTFGDFADLSFQASRMSTSSDNLAGDTSGLQQSPLLVASNIFLTSASGVSNFSAPNLVHDVWDSEELRLSSIQTRPLQWVLGLYRYHEEGNGANPSFVESATTAVGPSVGSLVFPPNGPVLSSDIPNNLNDDHAEAAFGQATWTPSFLEALHLTAGLRYSNEHKHGIVTMTGGLYPFALAAFGPSGVFDQSKTWSAVTQKENIAYDLTPSNMVYVDHSTGFTSGGYGYGGSPAYNPTHLWAWEIGSKNRFLDNKLQVNLSAWYYQYSGMTNNISDVLLVQFGPAGIVPPTPVSFITVANAGVAIDRGQSLDLQWNVTHDDQVGVNLQHINEIYTNYNLTANYLGQAAKAGVPFARLYPGYSATGNQSGPSFNYDGTRVGSVPDWSAYSTYSHTLRWSDRQLVGLIAYRYTGTELDGNQQAPNLPPSNSFYTLGGYGTWDLSLSYGPQDGRYTVTAFSRNLFNKLYATAVNYVNGGQSAVGPASSAFAYETQSFGAPRQYGIQVQASF